MVYGCLWGFLNISWKALLIFAEDVDEKILSLLDLMHFLSPLPGVITIIDHP